MTETPVTWTKPAPEYFRRHQLITQTGTGVELHRTVTEVGETYVAVSTPAAPKWGISYYGENVPYGDPSGSLSELLPPNVGLLHRRGLPRTTRALVNAMEAVLAGQLLPGHVWPTNERPLGSPLHPDGVKVFVPAGYDRHYARELVAAYAPYAPLRVTLEEPVLTFQASTIITVAPVMEES